MRVLLVSPSLGVGGAERVVVELADGLRRRGVEVYLLAPDGPLGGELDPAIVRAALPASGRRLRDQVAVAVAIRRTLARVTPQLVHAHNPRLGALVRVAGQSQFGAERAPLLVTHHGVAHRDRRGAALLLRVADHVACVSPELRDQLVAGGLASERVSVIRNGVRRPPALEPSERARLDRELGLSGGPVIAAVGRLVEQKAHHRLLAAIARALPELPGLSVLVVGDGPLRGALEARARALGIAHAVRFLGVRSDARALIARADLLVFSSEWEGLSVAALEALALGTPVLSTDVEGMRELAAHGAARLVPRDDGTALAAALVALARDQRALEKMADAAQRLFSARYTLDGMVDSYLDLYRALRLRAKRRRW